ncbi:MAG: hypothetical protein GXP03_01450 [Alphaproteobacteria bacterium]|nr:hypothetical protein [Alphaproteobacteria bacterium]
MATLTDNETLEAYRRLCHEIFFRAERVHKFRKKNKTAYTIFDLETVAIDIRKICELYGFLGILGNKKECLRAFRGIAKHRQLTKILRISSQLSGDQLPAPVWCINTNNGGHFEVRKVDLEVTPKLLLEVHGRVSFLLHAPNPFRENAGIRDLQSLFEFPSHIVETLKHRELKNNWTAVWGLTDEEHDTFGIWHGRMQEPP